jgi:hypothetical protein
VLLNAFISFLLSVNVESSRCEPVRSIVQMIVA